LSVADAEDKVVPLRRLETSQDALDDVIDTAIARVRLADLRAGRAHTVSLDEALKDLSLTADDLRD
jgi:hypothetical protein